MKRSVIVAAVALIAAALAFRSYRQRTVEKAYEKFAEEIIRRHYDVAAAMTTGMTEDELRASGTQEQTGGGPAMFQTLFPTRYQFESTTTASDGTLSINVVQEVRFNPAGVESAVRPAMAATMRQSATMRKVAGVWKIVSFQNKFEKMDSIKY
ncbi:MAG TPA: hypothetical protein VJ032_02710 [Thermoanaerobaculia bacterium]|nr:hypothetical protein [Thermoanaerobaculia bacterium]